MTILVLGAGAWGTALAHLLAANGNDVVIWAHRASVAESINRDHVNDRHLPELPLWSSLRAIAHPDQAPSHISMCLVVTPSQAVRPVLSEFRNLVAAEAPVIIASKGIEIASGKLMTEVAADIVRGAPLMMLSGPSFAEEVAQSLPTAVALACHNDWADIGQFWCQKFAGNSFRPYLNFDPVGVAVGGAVKNVIAIACGIAMGRGMGANAHAGLLTRGLAEMTRLALALGGRAETMMGLAGLGDLALTCSNTRSRNMSLGLALGQGQSLDAYCQDKVDIIEGIPNALAVSQKARSLGVDMPICHAVSSILHQQADIGETIHNLLMRPLRTE